MKWILLPILSIIFIVDLTTANNFFTSQPESTEIKNQPAWNLVIIDTPIKKTPNVQVGNEIWLKYKKGKRTLTVKGVMNAKGDPVICYLDANAGQKLTATLTPNQKTANIRINQIFMPDGKSDGPFGQELSYDLTQTGVYKIYLAPSLMAGDPYEGGFKLVVVVK